MATRMIETHIKARKLVKCKFTRFVNIRNSEDLSKLSTQELNNRIELLEGHWESYVKVQDLIDQCIDESQYEEEIDYKSGLEEIYMSVKSKLQHYRDIVVNRNNENKNGNQSGTTSNISFVPFQEDECFSNFIKRLEIFMLLRSIKDERNKVYTLLHALTPQLHQKLYDLCMPENPLDKDYNFLTKILREYVEPLPSVWARQHIFIQRIQNVDESVSEYATQLKKTITNCEFNCTCGKSITETLLRLQFIRGVKDGEIRTKLLQCSSETLTFNDILKMANNIELAKSEDKMMSKSDTNRSNEFFEVDQVK